MLSSHSLKVLYVLSDAFSFLATQYVLCDAESGHAYTITNKIMVQHLLGERDSSHIYQWDSLNLSLSLIVFINASANSSVSNFGSFSQVP